MTDSAQLCKFCSQIDFNSLRHPTVAEIQALETSEPTHSEHGSGEQWNLGLQSRIELSSASCRLCYAICELVRQNPRIKDHWESFTWANPSCVCRVEAIAELEPRPGTSWVDETGLEISRLQLIWHNEGEPEETATPGSDSDEGYLPNTVGLMGAFQMCCIGAPKLSAERLFHDYSPSPDELLFGGRIRPAMVDVGLPARWLKECLSVHGPGCGHLKSVVAAEPAPKLRLIDVKSKMIREVLNVNLSAANYIALSYVWGTDRFTTLTTRSLSELQQPGSLGPDAIHLAKTIRDAMAVTEELGFRYLWVDSLCIVQDDDDDKALQIGQMSLIYSQAVMTIVAAAGDSANAGLPGIGSPRTSEQIEVPLPQKNNSPRQSLLSSLSCESSSGPYTAPYQDTTWNSRGWTYQEYVLSNRLLIFMKHQVLWECGTCSWSEETHCETHIARAQWVTDAYIPRSKSSVWQAHSHGTDYYWELLSHQIPNYQLRRLSNEGDALDAFDGLLSQLERMSGETFIWGMPVSIFHSSLGYWPNMDGAPVRRTCLTTRKMTALKQQVAFPSWSWLGWADMSADVIYDTENYVEPGVSFRGNSYFMLRNLPLRLEPIGSHELPAFPLSLDDVLSSSSRLSGSKLEEIPDNQYICFRTQIISFSDAKPVQLDNVEAMPAGTTFFVLDDAPFMVSALVPYHLSNVIDRSLSGDLPRDETWNRIFIDKESHKRIGFSAICGGTPGPENNTKAPDLVYIKYDDRWSEECYDPYMYRPSDKEVTALEIVKDQGVSYKVNVARIGRSHWFGAASRMEVIVLG